MQANFRVARVTRASKPLDVVVLVLGGNFSQYAQAFEEIAKFAQVPDDVTFRYGGTDSTIYEFEDKDLAPDLYIVIAKTEARFRLARMKIEVWSAPEKRKIVWFTKNGFARKLPHLFSGLWAVPEHHRKDIDHWHAVLTHYIEMCVKAFVG